jgi:hypothetical protein
MAGVTGAAAGVVDVLGLGVDAETGAAAFGLIMTNHYMLSLRSSI